LVAVEETSLSTNTFEMNKLSWIRGTDLRITTDELYFCWDGTH
jgi:hypothetical protein